MDIPWNSVGEVMRAAVPSIIAAIVAWVGIQNWITARNKLAVDLFDRRFEVHRKLQQRLTERVMEIQSAHQNGRQPDFVNANVHSIWETIDDACFLFGDDVRAALAEVDDEIFAWGAVDPESWETITTASGNTGKQRATHARLDRFNRARHKLRMTVKPYMMLGHIAVNRPVRDVSWAFHRSKTSQ